MIVLGLRLLVRVRYGNRNFRASGWVQPHQDQLDQTVAWDDRESVQSDRPETRTVHARICLLRPVATGVRTEGVRAGVAKMPLVKWKKGSTVDLVYRKYTIIVLIAPIDHDCV